MIHSRWTYLFVAMSISLRCWFRLVDENSRWISIIKCSLSFAGSRRVPAIVGVAFRFAELWLAFRFVSLFNPHMLDFSCWLFAHWIQKVAGKPVIFSLLIRLHLVYRARKFVRCLSNIEMDFVRRVSIDCRFTVRWTFRVHVWWLRSLIRWEINDWIQNSRRNFSADFHMSDVLVASGYSLQARSNLYRLP